MTDSRDLPIKGEGVDDALHDLLGSAALPRMHVGFEQRLERAIADDAPKRRAARTARIVLWSYWVVATLVTVAIGWYVRDSFGPGPGLWISLGGAVCLIFAVLSFCLLASVPAIHRNRKRTFGR